MGNKTIEISGLNFEFPKRTAELLFFSEGNPQGPPRGISITVTTDLDWDEESGELDVTTTFNENLPVEPSTVFTSLPIKKPIEPESVPRPPYYPCYFDLTEEQRWIYLNWLQNLSQAINVGYVYLYFYGLERQLLGPQAQEALTELLDLYRHHPGIGYYCLNSLAFVVAKRQHEIDLNVFKSILNDSKWSNFHLYIASLLKHPISAKEAFSLANHLGAHVLSKVYAKKTTRSL